MAKKTKAKEKYQEYLNSSEWKGKRNKAIERAGGKCQVCNSDKNINVHHRTYDNMPNEQDADLTVLCRECHALFHGSLEAKAKVMAEQEKSDRFHYYIGTQDALSVCVKYLFQHTDESVNDLACTALPNIAKEINAIGEDRGIPMAYSICR